MDFTIKLKPDGTSETNAAADSIKRVREELEKTQKVKTKIDTRPRAVREAKEDRELDRAADRAAKALFKEDRDREKAAARQAQIAEKTAARDAATIARQRSQQEKELARKSASEEKDAARKLATEQRLAARQVAIEERKTASEQKAKERATTQRVKDDERKLAQFKKQQEREDKELERYAAKVQRDIIRDEKERAKAEERAASEKTKAQAKGGGNAKSSLSSLIAVKTVLAQQGVEALKFAAGLLKANFHLALGYQGAARLSMISAQASFNWRRLFMGTNPRPLLDAIQRTSQLIDPRTFTGKTLGEFITRSANGIFNFLAKAEPYVRLFFKGMLYGALQAEIAWLKLRIAIQPALNLLPDGIGLMTTFGMGALAVKGAFALMGVGVALGVGKAAIGLATFGRAALVATGPLLPLVAAVGALVLAYQQFKELQDSWDENSWTQIKTQLKSDLGLASKEETDAAMSKRQGITTGDDYDKKYKLGKYAEKSTAPAAPLPKDAAKQAAPAGANVGKQLGMGMLAGMKDTEAKVAGGGRDLVLAAEGGAKSAAVIKSPSQKWRKEIGRNLGEGAALGLEDSADRMNDAARAMVSDAPGIGAAGARGGPVVIQQIGPFYGVSASDERTMRRVAREVAEDFAEQIGALAI